jgi:hypothetical protein
MYIATDQSATLISIPFKNVLLSSLGNQSLLQLNYTLMYHLAALRPNIACSCVCGEEIGLELQGQCK